MLVIEGAGAAAVIAKTSPLKARQSALRNITGNKHEVDIGLIEGRAMQCEFFPAERRQKKQLVCALEGQNPRA
jgi:hypothetical protein